MTNLNLQELKQTAHGDYCLDCAKPTDTDLCQNCTDRANRFGTAQERIQQLRAEGDSND